MKRPQSTKFAIYLIITKFLKNVPKKVFCHHQNHRRATKEKIHSFPSNKKNDISAVSLDPICMVGSQPISYYVGERQGERQGIKDKGTFHLSSFSAFSIIVFPIPNTLPN